MIAAGLTAPTQSAAGIAAATASPALSYAIGQEFKDLAKQNKDGQRTAHILAHAVLGAAVAAAGDNDALAGALAAGGAEAAAPIISHYLYNEQDGSKLTAEQKETVTAITGLLGTATGAAVGNTTADAVSGSLNAQNAVENNYLHHNENKTLAHLKEQREKLLTRKMLPTGVYVYECQSQQCQAVDREIQILEKLSEQRDKEFDIAYENCRTGQDCNRFHYLHVTQRNKWNQEGIELFKQDLSDGKISSDWIRQPDNKNMFHNFSQDGTNILKKPDGSYPNTKYVHVNGQFEVILDQNGEIVNNPNSYGTYNYYPNDYKFGIPHKDYDVDPWADFGNGNGDNTTNESRRKGFLPKATGEFNFWDNKEEIIHKFQEIDRRNRK